MSRRRRQPAVATDLLAEILQHVDPTGADIVVCTPTSVVPPGATLVIQDLRGRRQAVHPAADLLLVELEDAAVAGTTVVPRPLQPAASASADFTALRIHLDAPSPLADQAMVWAKAHDIPSGIVAPANARGLALTSAAPALAPGAVLLDLGGDPCALLDGLALGMPVLFFDETPFRARLERAGAASRIVSLDTVTPEQLHRMSAAALAYVRQHHDREQIAAALRHSLAGALATKRRQLAAWPERGPGGHVLVISDEALNLIDIRVHRPFAALLARGAITGYALLRHGDFVFSTTPIMPELRFGAIWVQRSSDPLVQLLLRALGKPFVYDLDDLLCVSPSYRDPFPAEAIDVVRALARDCAALSCATSRLAQLDPAKAVVTPNLADGEPRRVPGRARTLVWASSDQPALAGARSEIERAVRDFCRAHHLRLLCIGAAPPATFADLDLEHVGLLSYDAYLARLRDAAPGLLVAPLDTGADPDTQAFIDAKSDIKVIEARRAGLVGVFSRAAPYLESDLAPAILCDNDYESWLEGLDRARIACERPDAPAAWPERRRTDALGPLPWADALRRAPTDVSAAEVAEALRFVRAQAETLLTAPELFDEADYLRRHADVREAVAAGAMPSGYRHYVQSGFREGRAARRLPTSDDAAQFWWSRLLTRLSRIEAEVASRDIEIDALRDRLALRRATSRPPEPKPAASLPAPGEIPGPCPVCDAPGPHPTIMQPLGHSLGRCGRCRSCFYADRTPYIYEDESEAALLLQLYLEQNAGIHQQTALLFATDDVDSVLDIGCGFGFAVDLATSLGWRAVGLDPSAMGAAGAAILGADIRPSYLDADTDLGGRFSLVLASEVIEHVAEPYQFLARLRAALAPGGTLVLTTPDAGALDVAIGDARALCITAPRVHLVLFCRESLTLALQRAGFRHVQVTQRDDSLLAFASDQILRFRTDAAEAHLAAYRSTLERLLDRAEPGTALWNGAAGRLFALLAPTADLTLLHALFARITAAWRDRFGFDLVRLTLPPLLPLAANALAARQPLNLAGVLLNRATLERRTPGHTPERVLAFARPAYLHALHTGRILQAANMIDHDLRQTAIRARLLIVDCLAELAPEVEAELLQSIAEPSRGALSEWLDPAPDALAAHLAPAFIRACERGDREAASRLAPWLDDLDRLSRALADQPEVLLRALYASGRHHLDDDPATALAAFERMAREARGRIDRVGHPSPAQDFLRVAKEHMQLASNRLAAG